MAARCRWGWEGSTENKTVARHLLADLVGRGLDVDDGLLVVIDGAKALSAAVSAVFGAKAAIQRCTVHKRRNVAEHLPEPERAWVDLKLMRALANPDAAGLRDAKALATALERKHPGAAASPREGLPERRSSPPRSPGVDARSYSATIASLYSGVNTRRRGRSERGPAAEELWQRLGHAETLVYAPFPTADQAWLVAESGDLSGAGGRQGPGPGGGGGGRVRG